MTLGPPSPKAKDGQQIKPTRGKLVMQVHARFSSMADGRYPVASEQYDRFLRGRGTITR
jgi:hypothetical protein